MPYETVDDLPDAIKDKYKRPAQRRAFMAAFNSTMDACEDDAKKCEQRAFASGHSAAQGVKPSTKAIRNAPKMAALMLRKDAKLTAVRNLMQAQIPALEDSGDFHTTMVYMDEGEHPKLPNIDGGPVMLTVTGAEVWDVQDGAKALVLTLDKTPELAALQKALYEHYAEADKSEYSEPEAWTPHITMGYMAEDADLPEIGGFSVEGKALELMQGDKTLSRKRLRGAKLMRDERGDVSMMGDVRYSQLEANYDPLGGDDFEACANCRWFFGNSCLLVSGEISPTGYSDAYAAIPMSEPELEIEMGFMARIKRWMQGPIMDTPSGFKVIDNGKRWLAWYSNAYEDKEGEIFPTQALQNDADYMWKTQEWPELWFYHIPGTKHGDADWVGLIGRFMVATGTFDDTPLAKALIKSYAHETVSHGFWYNAEKKVNGVYWDFHTFEISPTPQGAEANPLTSFEVKDMAVTDEQIAELKKRLPAELADSVLKAASDATKTVDEAGLRFKSPLADLANVQAKAANPEVDARLSAMEATINKMADAVIAIASAKADAPPPKEDDTEEEDMADKEDKSLPPALDPAFREALLADLQANYEKTAKEQKLSELDAADQIMARLMPSRYGG